jgi:hypothetical protein
MSLLEALGPYIPPGGPSRDDIDTQQRLDQLAALYVMEIAVAVHGESNGATWYDESNGATYPTWFGQT